MVDSALKPAGKALKDGSVHKRLVGGKIPPDETRDTELVFETYRDDVLIDRIEAHLLAGVTTRGHIHDLLAKAGFGVENEFGDYGSGPYRDGDPLIIEAVKV